MDDKDRQYLEELFSKTSPIEVLRMTINQMSIYPQAIFGAIEVIHKFSDVDNIPLVSPEQRETIVRDNVDSSLPAGSGQSTGTVGVVLNIIEKNTREITTMLEILAKYCLNKGIEDKEKNL